MSDAQQQNDILSERIEPAEKISNFTLRYLDTSGGLW
jgi:hypothetical protein